MDLNFKISYRKGTTNQAVDALSQVPGSSNILAIYQVIPSWKDNLQVGYQEDLEAKQLLIELALTGVIN